MTFSGPVHMTPAYVAKYNLDRGVGRNYASERDILNAPTDIQQLGILALILQEFTKLRVAANKDRDYMKLHGYFLCIYRDDVESTLLMVAAEQARIRDLLHGVTIGGRDMARQRSVDWYGDRYRNVDEQTWLGSFHENFRDLKARLARLRSVKTVEDISKLKGYGKKRSAEIIAKVKDRSAT